jgi:hypothetical protein
MNRYILCKTLCLMLLTASTYAQTLLLEGNLDDWQLNVKEGKTQYLPIMDMEQGVVIRAQSTNSASGYRYAHNINLLKTPIIKWQWTAQQLPSAALVGDDGIERAAIFDETKASGDDFVLRVSVGRESLFGPSQTLHYVWSSQQPIGSHWAIDEHTKVLVISGEQQTTMKWQTLMRHVQTDWLNAFDEDINSLDFVSFMTDSDNIHGQAIGYYGDMQMLAEQNIASE